MRVVPHSNNIWSQMLGNKTVYKYPKWHWYSTIDASGKSQQSAERHQIVLQAIEHDDGRVSVRERYDEQNERERDLRAIWYAVLKCEVSRYFLIAQCAQFRLHGHDFSLSFHIFCVFAAHRDVFQLFLQFLYFLQQLFFFLGGGREIPHNLNGYGTCDGYFWIRKFLWCDERNSPVSSNNARMPLWSTSPILTTIESFYLYFNETNSRRSENVEFGLWGVSWLHNDIDSYDFTWQMSADTSSEFALGVRKINKI